MQFSLPKYVNDTVFTLKNKGFEAFCVGGCVRDMLIGKKPYDYDITTNASPEDVIRIFPKTVKTGLKHGTVTVLQGKNTLEVTTYRTDGKYNDSRHPESVTFVKNLKEDLARRDFTVNAIAYNEQDGIKDFYGGIEDINKKLLKTVGNPQERFSEDALRILRLFRFSAQLNFSIEKNTLNSAVLLKDTVADISRERTYAELKKLIMADYPENAEYYINCGGLRFLGIEKAENLSVLKDYPKDFNLRFYVFCNACNTNAIHLCTVLKTDNSLKNFVTLLNLIKDFPLSSKTDIKKALTVATPDCVKSMLIIKNLPCDTLNNVLTNNEPYKLSQLALSGDDLKKIGVSGVKTGEILNKLLMFVIENPKHNKKEILLKKAQSIVTK